MTLPITYQLQTLGRAWGSLTELVEAADRLNAQNVSLWRDPLGGWRMTCDPQPQDCGPLPGTTERDALLTILDAKIRGLTKHAFSLEKENERLRERVLELQVALSNADGDLRTIKISAEAVAVDAHPSYLPNLVASLVDLARRRIDEVGKDTDEDV